MAPETCPNCGSPVPPRAVACPDCGADESTGWSDDAVSQHLDLPPDLDDFDHDEFVRNEFGSGRRSSLHPLWIITAIALTLVMLWWFL